MHALITGATRGIGKAMVGRYEARGDRVTGTYRGTKPEGDNWQKVDVADPASIAELGTSMTGNAIDLLVCNAAIYPDKGANLAGGYPAQMWADSFATNVTGIFLCVQTLLPQLQLAKNAKIAIISSQMASSERAAGGAYIYRASKAAAVNLGQNLAVDLSHLGIAVGIYHPGWVQTEMGGSAAAITADQSADGLISRFDALSLATTGCFETYDGEPHPY